MKTKAERTQQTEQAAKKRWSDMDGKGNPKSFEWLSKPMRPQNG